MKTHFADAINEVIKKKIVPSKTALATSLWVNSEPHSARTNLRFLANGKSKSVSIENVQALCRICNVSADYLFGLTDIPNYQEANKETREKLKSIAQQIDEYSNQI